MALIQEDAGLPNGSEAAASRVLDRLASYRQGALATYAASRSLFERAIATGQDALGPEMAACMNNFGLLLQMQGDFSEARSYYERALAIAGARSHYERALAISEKALGPDHLDTASSLNNLGYLLKSQGDLAGARPHL
jgi:tetratricopeptide (TPR) repeat protein